MAELAGYGGGVYYHTSTSKAAASIVTAIGGANNWTINWNGPPIETTDFSDAGTRTYIGGMKDWGGTFGGYYDTSVSYSSIDPGTALSMKFKLNSSHQIHGNVIITAMNPGVDVNGTATMTWNFMGTGAPTYA